MANGCNIDRVTIDMLPDVALLEIFDFYMGEASSISGWHTLVHVCRIWRKVVLESPHRLNLQLECTPRKPVRRMLDIWPPLPIIIRQHGYSTWILDNILAALEHNDRVCQISLWPIPSPLCEKVLAAMQVPFPALTRLRLWSIDEAIPDSFLGGSVPRLQELFLEHIPSQGLPKLLLSATDLVDLRLTEIPHSGYISPEAMVTCLAALTRLENLTLKFHTPRPLTDQESRRPPPLTCSVLPALNVLWFKGVSEYLEDLVARIDAPLLHDLEIIFLHQLIFDTPQLAQFISRAPALNIHDQARVVFSGSHVRATLPGTSSRGLNLGISCRQSDWQLSSLAQVCTASFPQALIQSVEHLYLIERGFLPLHRQDDVEDSQWLELLRPFTSVKNLYLSKDFTPRIAPSLQVLVGGNVIAVLPALQNLFYEELHPLGPSSGPAQEAIWRFAIARRLSNHPIAISHWERS